MLGIFFLVEDDKALLTICGCPELAVAAVFDGPALSFLCAWPTRAKSRAFSNIDTLSDGAKDSLEENLSQLSSESDSSVKLFERELVVSSEVAILFPLPDLTEADILDLRIALSACSSISST